jgi:hypothetical protein
VLTRLTITLALGVATCLALGAAISVPGGVHAARTVAAANDPARLADLALDHSFDAPLAVREINAALAAGDTDLARSFVDLAAERGVALPETLIAKTQAAEQDAATASSRTLSFARGFVTGRPEDMASAAGMVTGDLLVFGDIRDVVREGWNGLRGEEVDPLVLGLAGTGLAMTAGVYASGESRAAQRAPQTAAGAAPEDGKAREAGRIRQRS